MNKEYDKKMALHEATIVNTSITLLKSLIEYADKFELKTESDFRGMIHNHIEFFETKVFKEENMS